MNKSISTLLSARRKLISRDKEKDDHRRTVLKGWTGIQYRTKVANWATAVTWYSGIELRSAVKKSTNAEF